MSRKPTMKHGNSKSIIPTKATDVLFNKYVRVLAVSMLLLCTVSGRVYAQKDDSKRVAEVMDMMKDVPSDLFVEKLDTLKFKERISLRVNAIDWMLVVPSVNVEVDLLPYNWSKWTIGFSGKFNGFGKGTFNPYYVYDVSEAKLEVRHYWHTAPIGVPTRKPMESTWGKMRRFLSRQKEKPRFRRAYYVGAYAAYTHFSIKLGSEGKQGNLLHGGFSFGYQLPLYGYTSGNHIDLELGLSAGAGMVNYDKYTYDSENDCYQFAGTQGNKIVPVLSELRFAFVYRFGRSSLDRYKDRYRVDNEGEGSYGERYRNYQLQKSTDALNKKTEKEEKAKAKQAANEEKAKQKAAEAEAKRNKKLGIEPEKKEEEEVFDDDFELW